MSKFATLPLLIAATLFGPGAGAAAPDADPGEPLALEWGDLLPPLDDPDKAVEDLFDTYDLDELLASDEVLNDFIDKATDLNVNMTLDGKLIKLPGYVLPIETTGNATREFLLLPYHGACIHVPPPPINQTVYVKMRDGEAAKIRGMFDTLVITGILHAEKNVTGFANAGYRIDAIRADKYR